MTNDKFISLFTTEKQLHKPMRKTWAKYLLEHKETLYAISILGTDVSPDEEEFGKRIVHGYFVLSAAAGLFVSPGFGPVLANVGW